MSTYFSTFISGLSPIVESWLKQNVSDMKIKKLLDGLVIYETGGGVNVVREFPIFNNSFVLLKEFVGPELPVFDFEIERTLFKGYKTFRVIFSNENQISKINKNKLDKYEQKIIQKSRLFVDRTNPDTEIWILKRSEGLGLVGLRITQNINPEKVLHKGELRPQLAYLLNFISDPKSTDVFLDPFAGYGSIPKARINYFPAKQIIANDKDQSFFANLKETIRGIEIENWDALDLKEIEDSSIDRIVTDPPWGIFIKDLNIEDFYKRMSVEFTRIIKPNGIVVILTSQKDLMDKLLGDSDDFELSEKLDILVSGKKSSVYKIKNVK